ncbi:unnamed protein product [[Candida] boidinii]|uniref:Unnamed protein product n=1 Tax=Candida boidinii TaxID=5477 RepID=A0ACB5TRW9_CANBO|nr:unnamed protein product [[Candida] boidinii]
MNSFDTTQRLSLTDNKVTEITEIEQTSINLSSSSSSSLSSTLSEPELIQNFTNIKNSELIINKNLILNITDYENYKPLPDSDLNNYDKIICTLITNENYLHGLINLNYSLKLVNSKYPLIALYTPNLINNLKFQKKLDSLNIKKLKINYLNPLISKNYEIDTRFNDCWTKLQAFSLFNFKKIILLDSDMIILKNFDELMDLKLSENNKVFAASHACLCNPFKKSHYPKNWHKLNCKHTLDKDNEDNDENEYEYEDLHLCNSGLLVIDPLPEYYELILKALNNEEKTKNYIFPDQDLISDIFKGKWLSLSYIYNCLKTFNLIHKDIWDINEIKIIHYILTPKPWNLLKNDYSNELIDNQIEKGNGNEKTNKKFNDDTETFKYWFDIDNKRLLDKSN